MIRNIYNVNKKFLQPLDSVDAIIGGIQVKLYRNLEEQITLSYGKDRVRHIISWLKLRRMIVPVDQSEIHFYLVKDRQDGITVERALQQFAISNTSVA